ncbi:MAG: Tim10/DDP family zinc finger protein, partial [Actinobacteria bacterium]|nr:Tim10/DDP family zinc finger protein [Actinomycetota bacterium]
DDWLGMAVDNALGNFIDQYLGIGWLCEPFDIDIKIALLKQPTFKEEARCSISDIVGNIEDFYNDFSVGGWGGWIKLTEGGNNVYSTYLIAMEEIQKIQTIEEKEQEAEIARGSGFFSPKDCVWYDGNNKPIDLVVESSGKRYTTGYDDVWGTASLPAKCAPSANILAEPFETDGLHKDGSSVVGPCYKKCISHTPGKQISDSVSKTVNRFWDTINAQIGAASAKAGPYSIYVEAILTALVNRAFKEGYGLLFAQNQSIPGEGDCGAACELPKIIDPTEIKQDVAAAKLLKPELSTIKVALDKLLKEQKDNLAVWNLIVKKYEDILLILDDMTKDHPLGCGETSYDPSYITWAKNKKIEVDDIISTIKNTNIKNLTDIIAKTVLQINNIDNIIIPAINAYIDAVDVWEKAYEDSGGTTNDDVEKALKALNDAKNIAILAVQNLFKAIMGTSTGTTFTELKAESYLVFDQIYVLIDQYYTERGTSAFPEPGTIWGDYETAVELEEDAQGRLDKCQTWGN